MFFKKRRQKQAREHSDRRVEKEKAFHAAIVKAGLMEDPAEKIIRLQELDRLITNYLGQEAHRIADKAYTANRKAFGSGASASVYTVMGGMFFTGPLGWTVMGAGAVLFGGTLVGSTRYSESVKNKLTQEASGHVAQMKLLRNVIDVMTDVTIENNPKEIAKSPLREEVYALPSLTKKFAVVAAKHFAAEETPAVEKVATPAETKDVAAAPKGQTSDFRYVKGVLRKPQNPDSKP